jgi:DNA polymerase-3 subunit delta
LVGDRDQTLVVEEVGGPPGDDINVGAVVDACLTPPFLIDRRVVVVREAGRLLTADVPRLIEVVNDPLPTTVLILVGGSGVVPPSLSKAVRAHGRVIDVSTSKTGDRKTWLAEHLRSSSVKLEPQAAKLLGEYVWEDLGRVEGLLGALAAAYGEGNRITAEDLAPYLGEAGNVPRYELTEAIDAGDPKKALTVLHRMLDAGGLAAVQVLSTLHIHFANMLALDGGSVAGEREAADVLGTAPFVAKKALEQSRRLGRARIAAAINLIARADLDVKGGSGLPPELLIEILVARLSRQTRPRAAARR